MAGQDSSVGKKARKKNNREKEVHNKLMESYRFLLCAELALLVPMMLGLALTELEEIHQVLLLGTFLLMGYIGAVALILVHTTEPMRWSAVVSAMTLIVTLFWLGIFHFAVSLITPKGYKGACDLASIFLYLNGSLLIAFMWGKWFQHPKSE